MRSKRWVMLRLCTLTMTITACFAIGDQESRARTGDPSERSDSNVRLAPVVIDGQILFSVRGVTALPAERRAREIAGRIRALAADPHVSAKSLTLNHEAEKSVIFAKNQFVMNVLDADAAIEEVGRVHLAEVYRARMTEAIDEYRLDRQPAVLLSDALHALGATLALIAVVFGGRMILARTRAALERRYRSRVQGLEKRSFQIVKADQIWRAITSLLNIGSTAIAVSVFYIYTYYVLALFPWTRWPAKTLFSLAMDPLRTIGVGLVAFVPNLAFLIILFFVTRYALKLLGLLFDGIAAGTVTLRGFDAAWSAPTLRLVRLMVVAFAVVVAYPYIPGSGSEAFKGVSLFIGIVFSLGSSSLIGNLIAGYGLTYRRTFKIGDRVKIGGNVGTVETMRLLVTHLRTTKNEELVVPNSMILGNEVLNYSSMAREHGLILHTTVGIGYETPWRQVEAMLFQAASRTEGIQREPSPFVLQKELGDFCITYEINAYCETPQAMEELYANLHRNILDVFNEYGVQIMTPAYEGDPAQPKVVAKQDWYATPARPPVQEPAAAASAR